MTVPKIGPKGNIANFDDRQVPRENKVCACFKKASEFLKKYPLHMGGFVCLFVAPFLPTFPSAMVTSGGIIIVAKIYSMMKGNMEIYSENDNKWSLIDSFENKLNFFIKLREKIIKEKMNVNEITVPSQIKPLGIGFFYPSGDDFSGHILLQDEDENIAFVLPGKDGKNYIYPLSKFFIENGLELDSDSEIDSDSEVDTDNEIDQL